MKLSLGESQYSKYNGNKNSPTNAPGKLRGQRSQMRRYTERSDGVAVTEFSRCEIFPSSPEAAGTTCLGLIKTHSIGTSPFEMAKVRAALQADVIDNHEKDELHPDNYHEIIEDESQRSPRRKFMGSVVDPDFIPSRVNKKCESSVDEKRLHHGLLFVPLDESSTANSFLKKFEELLYTSEVEEELIHRDIVKNQLDDGDCATNIIHEENEDICLRSQMITTQRQDEINQYATERCTYQNLQRELLTKNGGLQYDAILAIFVESILERIIEDIAGELEEVILEEMRYIVSNL